MKFFFSFTHYLIYVTAIFWILYDVIAFHFGGPYGASTESVIVGNWIEDYPWFAYAISVLFGHLTGSGTNGLTFTRGAIIVVGLVTGYALSRLS